MPTIRIDSEVMDELKKRAIKEGLVFGSPNDVLRRVLDLDPILQPSAPEQDGIPPESSGLPDVRPLRERSTTNEESSMHYHPSGVPRLRGSSIIRVHHPELRAYRPYSDRDGGFYSFPSAFPAVLFDATGYLVVNSEDALLEHFIPSPRDDGYVVGHFPLTIQAIPDYVRCNHRHEASQ